MCRLAAYLGPEISLGKFLMEPCHSLYRQSWEPREMQKATLNADGFGFGWLDPSNRTVIYTNTCPIWSDMNLAGLCNALSSRYWLANVRSATPTQQITQTNTHPFKFDQLLFTHNGYIKNFNPEIRTHFHHVLIPAIQAGIQGNTDSEYIFALLRQKLTETPDISEAILEMLATLQPIIAGEEALLNLIIGDSKQFYILRHAINGDCPSLYFSIAEDELPDSMLIASEALTDSGNWQPIPLNSYATIADNRQPIFVSL